jgi:hypothetical protein
MMTNLKSGTPVVYAPVGRCIYCGNASGKLSKEHVIPLGLAGDMILPKASCARCAKITGEVERFCLRPMLGDYRSKLNFPTRRPSERPPTTDIIHRGQDGNVSTGTISFEDYPLMTVGYRLPPPGILIGGQRDDPIEGDVIVKSNVHEFQRLQQPGKQVGVKLGTFNTLKFMRMLAKIGHAHAVAKLGIDTFSPLLPDLILGTSEHARWLVGADPNAVALPAEPTIHELWLEHVEVDAGRFLLAGIRLFSYAQMPKYHVVVGELAG